MLASPCPELHFAVDLLLPSVPVAGRLSLFLDSWKSITRDQYVLHLFQLGLHLSFESQPLLSTSPVPFPLPEASSKREHLRAEILSMLEKGAIERVVNESSPGFYSLIFVIPPQNGKLRLVIDLRSLNHHLRKEPPKEGEVSYGNTRKSAPLDSEGGLGDLDRFDGRISTRANPPIVEEVSSFPLSGRSVPVSGPTLRLVGEHKTLHPCGGCDDGPCLISRFTGSPLSRRAWRLGGEGGLGDLVRFDGRISTRANPPIVEEVSSFPLSGRSVPVSGPTLRLVGERKSLHPCGGCDDGPCLISRFTGSPLSRRAWRSQSYPQLKTLSLSAHIIEPIWG